MPVAYNTTLVMPCHPSAETYEGHVHLHLSGGMLSKVTAVGTREQLLAYLEAAISAVRTCPVPFKETAA